MSPFQATPGGNSRDDRPASLDIGRALYHQRLAVAQDKSFLKRLMKTVDRPEDLRMETWAQLYSTALEMRPDVILELGRGYGNSTALFCQAVNRLRHGKVTSGCLSDTWRETTVPRLKKWAPPELFDGLDARTADILDFDFAGTLAGSSRVLVFWDAHGLDVAEVVLGRILPLVEQEEHLLLIHDIADTRYAENLERSYAASPMWKGARSADPGRPSNIRINLGWMSSEFDELIALADFLARNNLELGSSDHEYHRLFEAHPEYRKEIVDLVGEEMFSLHGPMFLSLNGKEGPFHFPVPGPARPRAAVSRGGLGRILARLARRCVGLVRRA